MKLLAMIFVIVLIMAFTTVAVQAFPVFSSVADADTWNRANFPNNNWGAPNVITNGAAGTNLIFFNSFIFWDLPDEVIGEEILSATLAVPLRNVPTGAANDYALQAYDQSWVEGTGIGSESGDGVTFSTYDGTNLWPGSSTAGGFNDRVDDGEGANRNFDVQHISEATYGDENTAVGTVVFDATDMVQFWSDGNLNAGLSIQVVGSLTGSSGSFSFWGREKELTHPGLAPVLEVTYVPEPASLAMIAVGAAVLARRRRRV
mgnify:CR=1 FL=1